jgi:NADPH:quinone reductase-like Zn-dependent oxidoreductase
LVNAVGISANDIVVVSAAAGGVGSLVVQWARELGATVVGLAGPRNHDWLRGYGVVPVDYAGPDLTGRIRSAVDGRQVSAVLDTHGPEYVQLGIDLGVRPDRIASIADFTAGERGAHAIQHTSVARPEVLTEIAQLLASGRIELPIAATYPLAEVSAAYRDLEGGHTRGKIVLVP